MSILYVLTAICCIVAAFSLAMAYHVRHHIVTVVVCLADGTAMYKNIKVEQMYDFNYEDYEFDYDGWRAIVINDGKISMKYLMNRFKTSELLFAVFSTHEIAECINEAYANFDGVAAADSRKNVLVINPRKAKADELYRVIFDHSNGDIKDDVESAVGSPIYDT